jgi:hypothetical protein
MNGQQTACPICGKQTFLQRKLHYPPPAKHRSGAKVFLILVGSLIGVAVVVSSCNAIFGNTSLMRDTTIRDAHVLQIEQSRKELVEWIRAEIPTWTNFSTNVAKENDEWHHDYNRKPQESPKELVEYFSNTMAEWDRKTPQQRHQDARDEEWAEYQRGKASDEAQKEAYRQTLWDLTHEDKAKDNTQKEVDKFLRGEK